MISKVAIPSRKRHVKIYIYARGNSYFLKKIDVLQSRPSAGGHKILNFTSKMLDFSTTGYLPFFKFFECIFQIEIRMFGALIQIFHFFRKSC